MPKQKAMPKCAQKRRECFACNKEGKCKILTDTKFKKNGHIYQCPFFKTLIEVAMQEMERKSTKYELR